MTTKQEYENKIKEWMNTPIGETFFPGTGGLVVKGMNSGSFSATVYFRFKSDEYTGSGGPGGGARSLDEITGDSTYSRESMNAAAHIFGNTPGWSFEME